MWEVVKVALIELLWPIFKDILKKYGKELIDWLVGIFKEKVGARNVKNAAAASKKADEFQAAAESATTVADAEKQAAVAQVWREVAEMFRQENASLTIELQRLRAEAVSVGGKAIDRLSFNEAIIEKDGRLQAANRPPLLPK